MTKLLAALLSLALLLSLSACTSQNPTEASSTPETTSPTETQSNSDTLREERYFEYYEIIGENWVSVDPTEDMLLIQSLFDNTSDDITPNAIGIQRLSDQGSFEYHTTLPYDESIAAYHCATLMNHSPIDIVFLRTPPGTDMAAICDHAKEYLDPKKEICTIFDYTHILYTEETALFIMGNGDLPGQIQSAFLEIYPDATVHTFCDNRETAS